jgi:hypothetical protein
VAQVTDGRLVLMDFKLSHYRRLGTDLNLRSLKQET